MDLQSLITLTDHEHSRKVSAISKLLAVHAGYSSGEADMIGQAALYHDVGKCDIPPDILNKPGELTSREFEIIKLHTDLGSKRIKDALDILLAAYEVAKYHHERCDGTGYNRLAAGEIHPYAKLVAIADVFDALASQRVYKSRWDIGNVFGYITEQAGIQFDMDIVSALIAHPDEIAALYQ